MFALSIALLALAVIFVVFGIAGVAGVTATIGGGILLALAALAMIAYWRRRPRWQR